LESHFKKVYIFKNIKSTFFRMSNDYNTTSFKKLLVKLQEESWQLELIISGFAIFGLFSAIESINVAGETASIEGNTFYVTLHATALISCSILLFNLLLHVILRGLWIGTIGLRYVSGDIDYDTLKYSKKFTKYLKKRVGSFDKYISNLENYCSIIFAISFLLIFYVLAFTLTIFSIYIITTFTINNDSLPEALGNSIGVPLILFVVFGMLLTFIDFITQGWLKKKQWLSKIYFPFYWVFSFITLSFLYRPLVYNFLDNKFCRRLSFVLVPLFFIISIMTTINYRNSNYWTTSDVSSGIYANNSNYENLLINKDDFIDVVAIPSKVISDSYLKIF